MDRKRIQDKIQGYFTRYTIDAEQKGKKAEQDRIRGEFNDKRIHLRFNVNEQCWQIWYDSPSGLYCIFNAENPLNPARIIKQLAERQKSPKAMLDAYQKSIDTNEKKMKDKIDDISREVTNGLKGYARGKVITS